MMMPLTDDDNYASTKSIHLSLRNSNRNHKIAHKTKNNNKKNIIPNTNDPNYDTTDDDDNADVYPYSLHNRKNKKNNMTPNTDAPNNNSPDAADDDAASSDSLILDYSHKPKIDPKSMLKTEKNTDSIWFRRSHQWCLPQRNQHIYIKFLLLL